MRWDSHKQESADYHKAYNVIHKYETSARKKIYTKINKISINIRHQKRKAMKRGLLHTLTMGQWTKMKNDFNNKCAYCGEVKPLTQDHLFPLFLGGEYTTSNIIPACTSCNCSKGPKLLDDWYPNQPYYDKAKEHKILSYLGYKNNIQQLSFM